MSLLGKSALALVIPAAGALVASGAGTAQAGGLYGAIAVGTFQVGHATDYPSQAAANQAALDACGVAWCRVTLEIQNGCGSVVEKDNRGLFTHYPVYYYGTGATGADAERMAFAQVPPNTPWATAISLAYGSSMMGEPYVRNTVCTANAG
ncbi:DUF4189 domain-containing protein [Nocardia sp. NPDC050406]|uniref:DUF4189 domain-containing protein n=1 Tax=Nocardia sp. NPDC050406 TaxID=3364318 RepID=UPI0037AC2961